MKTLGSNQDPRPFAVELTKPPWQTVLPTLVILSLEIDKFSKDTPTANDDLTEINQPLLQYGSVVELSWQHWRQ